MTVNIVVAGGGAAGMMAAITAAEKGCNVVLLEKNEKLGKKLYITGKGRCNLTNNCSVDSFLNNVVSNPKFLYGAANAFPPADVMDFFERLSLPLKTEQGGRVFPRSDKSSDVIAALQKRLQALGADVRLKETVLHLEIEEGKITAVATDKNIYSAHAVILATGGVSYPLTGSTGDGYRFAEATGHRVTEPKPALCPILLASVQNARKERIPIGQCRFPQGLSLKNAQVRILDGGKRIREEFGELLFTEGGVSGPVVLTLSSHINRLDFSSLFLIIDSKPALDEKKLDERVQRDFAENKCKMFKNALNALLPQSLIPLILELSCIPPDTFVHSISRVQRENLLRILKGLTFEVKGLAPFSQAVVTAGGVSVKDIDAKTMRSKRIPNLYFAGEVIDTDAYTGGYNLQIAWATGRAAGAAAGDV
jgi:predicted Rossmann fold flavoprotein